MINGIVPTVGTFRKRPILCNAPQESESQICGIVSTLVHLVEAVRVADLRDQLRVRVHSLEAQPEIRGKIRDDKG